MCDYHVHVKEKSTSFLSVRNDQWWIQVKNQKHCLSTFVRPQSLNNWPFKSKTQRVANQFIEQEKSYAMSRSDEKNFKAFTQLKVYCPGCYQTPMDNPKLRRLNTFIVTRFISRVLNFTWNLINDEDVPGSQKYSVQEINFWQDEKKLNILTILKTLLISQQKGPLRFSIKVKASNFSKQYTINKRALWIIFNCNVTKEV